MTWTTFEKTVYLYWFATVDWTQLCNAAPHLLILLKSATYIQSSYHSQVKKKIQSIHSTAWVQARYKWCYRTAHLHAYIKKLLWDDSVTCARYYIYRCICSHSSHNALHSLVHYLLQANAIHKLSKSTAIQPLKVGVMVQMVIITGDRLSSPGLKWLMSSY